jgi:hypothetical protein
MKIFISFALSIFYVCTLFAQDVNSKYCLDFFVQPNVDYLIEKPDNSVFMQPSFYKFGINLGVLINYSLTDKFYFGSGFRYINRGYIFSLNKDQLTYSDNNDIPKKLTDSYNYNYFSIPFKFSYSLFNISKVKISPSIGLGFDYLFNIKTSSIIIFDTHTDNQSTNISVTGNINRISLSGLVGIDFSYQIKEKLYFLISPNYDMMLTPLQKSGLFTQYFYRTYFWNLGCSFCIRKTI